MKGGLRKSMAWLHTWLGLLLGWLLYFMFVTGTVGYLDTEIDRWMRPELPVARYPLPTIPTVTRAVEYLQMHAPDARRWLVRLPIDRNEPYLQVFWQGGTGAGSRGMAWLDPDTGARIDVRATGGGQTLYQMHWRLHYMHERVAEWLVGIASMILLVALITGIVAHRRIFADFFTFRPGKGQRSWLDAHNLASVASLPFQLMISYSGLIFVMFSFLPLIVAGWYGPGSSAGRAFSEELFPPLGQTSAAGLSATQIPVERLLQDVQNRWGQAQVATLDFQHPGDANARISVVGDFAAHPVRMADILVYDAVSGSLVAEHHSKQSGPKTFRDLMLGLHEGLFAEPVLRMLYVLSGALGVVMIATGLVLWTVKRRQRIESSRAAVHPGLKVVERLNIAVIIGLPCAIATYFFANRLLPFGLAQREHLEIQAMFIAWGLLFIHAWVRPSKAGWQEQAWLAAALFAFLPVLNALTTQRHLVNTLAAGDWVMAGFDLSAFALAVGFVGIVQFLRRKSS